MQGMIIVYFTRNAYTQTGPREWMAIHVIGQAQIQI